MIDMPPGEERVVVCLEDDPDLARLIQVTVRPWTDAFHVAYDGFHGLELIRRKRPALILLDLNLPGMNGLEVYAALQADPALRHTPVIVLSANHHEPPSQHAPDTLENVAAYITKPFSLTELRDSVRPYLSP